MDFTSSLWDIYVKGHRDALAGLLLPLSVIFAVTWYAWIYFFQPNPNPRLPPGPPGLPLLGNLLSLDPQLHSYFTTLSLTYGPILTLRLGAKLGIVITSPAMARQVLKDHDVTFANRDVPAAARVANYGGCDIAWSPYGSEWRMLRKVCALKMLSNTTLDSVYTLRRKEVRRTVGYVYRQVGAPVDIGEQMFLTALNVITSMLWGGTVEGQERDTVGAELRELVSRMTELFGIPNLSDFFPGLGRFDLQGVEKKMNAVAGQLDQMIEKMIQQRLKMNNEQNVTQAEGNKDFLQFLLKLKDEGDSKTPLTMTHVKALLMLLQIFYAHKKRMLYHKFGKYLAMIASFLE